MLDISIVDADIFMNPFIGMNMLVKVKVETDIEVLLKTESRRNVNMSEVMLIEDTVKDAVGDAMLIRLPVL